MSKLTRVAVSRQCDSLRAWYTWQLNARSQGHSRVSMRAAVVGPDGDLFHCSLCEYTCSSGAGLAGHMHARHAHKALARLYAPGSHCRACLKQLWTEARLVAHLSGETECLAILVASVDEQEQDPSERPLDAEDGFDFSRAPMVQLSGPRRQVPQDARETIANVLVSLEPFARTALCRSAATFNRLRGGSEMFDCILEACAPRPLSKGDKQVLLPNPDGRSFIARSQEAISM